MKTNTQERFYTRDAYGDALLELGERNKDIVALDADLAVSTRTAIFGTKFPERFFDMGVAEQNTIGVAAGLAACGKIPFVSTFAMFGTGRAWEQIRNTVCYNNLNMKIVFSHAGITVGEDGSSHQALEDLALMRPIPNMVVIVPCDAMEIQQAVIAACAYKGPVYIRMGRSKVPCLNLKGKFKIGKARVLRDGKDIAIVACGIMVEKALAAAEILEKEGRSVAVINMHTIKPLDSEIIAKYARKVKRFVACEEHMVTGGLGSAVAEALSQSYPLPLERIGIKDRFGQSGKPDDLIKEYGLSVRHIVAACKKGK